MTGEARRREATFTPRPIVWPGLWALVGCCILVALGMWQLHRLAWKEALLARMAERIGAAPVPLPSEAAWRNLAPDDYEYRRVAVTGVFEHENSALVFRPQAIGPAKGAGPGYLVLTPLRLASGAHVIVDRGFVPLAMRGSATRAGQAAGEVRVTGLMRGPEPRNLFTPADNPGRAQWSTRDPATIAAHFKLDRPAPFSIDADATTAPGEWPAGGQTLIDMPNNHFAYALTWFGLAATLAGVFAAYAWKPARRQ